MAAGVTEPNITQSPHSLRRHSKYNPDSLFVLPIGVGNAFTTRFYHTSFFLVCNGTLVLIDAPGLLGRAIREATTKAGYTANLQSLDHIFITHLHGDHTNGLEEIGFWRMFLGNKVKPVIHIHEELVTPLWENKLKAAMGRLESGDEMVAVTLEDYFDIRPFSSGATLDFGIPDFKFETRQVDHGMLCTGFRVSYRGASLGYSADTRFDPTLFDFFKDCTMILHETSPGEIHTSYASLLGLSPDVKSKMHLVHLGDDFQISASEIPVLEEGKLYTVPKPGQPPA